MADTRVQLEIEGWVREKWMPEKFGCHFYRNRLSLTSGGVFDFDAVSQDRKIAACISTSGGKTARGKHAVGKLLKLRSDMLFLLLAKEPEKRIIVLTEPDMFEVCSKEKAGGRVPQQIEFVLAELPEDLRQKLTRARNNASKEVSPGNEG
ncbi:MAG: hypothetical protein K6U74_05615 [Firmicutes bacterium]|nr:hypothetical protein [Bacillota bacterium]